MAYAVQHHEPAPVGAPTLAEVVALADGTTLTVRPVNLTDAFQVRRMFGRLSPESVYHRFFSPIPEPGNAVLRHLLDVDHSRREALIAIVDGEIVALANYVATPDGDVAEVAVAVEDAWQDRGVGTELAARLARVARRRGVGAFTAVVMGENNRAVRFLRRLSPDTDVHFAHGEYAVQIPLRRATSARSLTR
jgi:ribosomal protein S18 acetylase RimI-like enzyme